MKKTALTASIALALAAPLMADAAKSPAPKDDKEKISYSIGANIGTGVGADLKQSGIEISNEFLAQGLKDALEGKLVMSEEERGKALETVMQKVQAQAEEQMRNAQAEMAKAGEANKTASAKFLEENKKKDGVKTTTSGLQYKELSAGKGAKPKASDTVEVHYKGTLIDGTEFDSSHKRNQTATFQLDEVVPGWTEGIQLMPVGSKFEFVIPSELAYGEMGRPPVIGPSQALVFEVELIGIKDDAKKGE